MGEINNSTGSGDGTGTQITEITLSSGDAGMNYDFVNDYMRDL